MSPTIFCDINTTTSAFVEVSDVYRMKNHLRWLPTVACGMFAGPVRELSHATACQNKTKIDHAFFKNKAISERFLMEKSVE
jgi:hypothetical protein